MTRALNPSFKLTQVLPRWPLETVAVAARQPKAPSSGAAILPRADEQIPATPVEPPSSTTVLSFAGHILVGMVAFNLVIWGLEGFATLVEIAEALPQLGLWMTRILG